MENNPSLGNLFNLGVDPSARDYLRSAASWAKIIAYFNFISAGLSIIDAAFGTPGQTQMGVASSVVFTMIVVGIIVVINIFLLRFANNTLNSLANMNQQEFNEGINNLRIYFKIWGILFIILVSIIFLVILFAILGRSLS